MKTSKEMAESVKQRSQKMMTARKKRNKRYIICLACICGLGIMIHPKKQTAPENKPYIIWGVKDKSISEGMYASPKNGQVFTTFSMVLEHYHHQDVRYLVCIDVFFNEEQISNRERTVEYLRLFREGIFFFHLEDDNIVCLLSAKDIKEKLTNQKYGYFLRFVEFEDSRFSPLFDRVIFKDYYTNYEV